MVSSAKSDSSEKTVMSSAVSDRRKPTRPLPTDRIDPKKQVELLRAFAAISGAESKPVRLDDVASAIKLTASTVSLSTAFFCCEQLLTKTAEGFVPAPAVQEFARAYTFNPDQASYKLAKVFRKAWFGELILAKLSFRSLGLDEAIGFLADEVSASSHYRCQLVALLVFLEVSGLIVRENGTLRLASQEVVDPAPSAKVDKQNQGDDEDVAERKISRKRDRASNSLGGIQFDISLSADMAEISAWSPERISAFFDGVAKVIAAKKGLDVEVIDE